VGEKSLKTQRDLFLSLKLTFPKKFGGSKGPKKEIIEKIGLEFKKPRGFSLFPP